VIGEEETVDKPEEGTDWLKLARESYDASSSYFDANHRKSIERNIALFQSRHPDGSKYNSAAYKHRSRLFRPKTKSVVRKNEAAAAAAFFANVDVVSVEAENESDQMQVASAELVSELLNYRLQKTIPWYLLLLGALQDAQVIGVVCSYQYWKYKERKAYQPLLDDVGEPMVGPEGPYMEEVPEVVEDKPCIELIPRENFRFDPGANWTDVVGSSPYFIRLVPMYVDDVRQEMKSGKWHELSDGQIRTAMADYDTIRLAREGKKQDPIADNNAPLTDFEIVWAHENFVRRDGEEVVYWTLGTQHLLTDPVPLKEAYFHGQRPFVIGQFVIETHKTEPESLVSIGAQMQRELNDTVNQRRDNVSLVLNKRWLVSRTGQVDVNALNRNVPGGAIMVNDVQKDVLELNWPDVTASAYAEQDRLNVDFDELTGNFSQSSIASNRQLNETVGGMKMLGGASSQMTEYGIRTFVETWVEPVLRQVVKLEQMYETDVAVLGLAGERAQLAQKYGVNAITDELLNQELTTRVNVGLGATDPQQKLGRFMAAMQAYAMAVQVPGAVPEAIQRQVFGLAGYRDGGRFFQPNAQQQMLMQQMQQMGQEMQAMQMELQALKTDKRAEALKAETDGFLKAAQMDLTEAQTVKTLVEAKHIPSQAMAKKATNVG
jgi:hypothetical protein